MHCLSLVVLLLTIQQTSTGPSFIVHSTSAQPFEGMISGMSKERELQLHSSKQNFTSKQWYRLRRAGRSLPAWPRGPHVILTNGDRIAGQIVGGDVSYAILRPLSLVDDANTTWRIPFTAIAAVWFTTAPASTPPDPAQYAWLDTSKRRDGLKLMNGDSLRGVFVRFQADPVSLLWKNAENVNQTFQADKAAVLVMDPSLSRSRKPARLTFRLVTADGSRISLSECSSEGSALIATTVYGGKLILEWQDVIALDVIGGPALELTDLKAVSVQSKGSLSVAWPIAFHRTVKGDSLRLKGPFGIDNYDSGIGMHSSSRIEYASQGKYKRLIGVVGLDPRTGTRGSAEIRILADGKDLLDTDQRRLSAADRSRKLDLDVSNVKAIVLITDYGLAGDVQDDVNWCDLWLVP